MHDAGHELLAGEDEEDDEGEGHEHDTGQDERVVDEVGRLQLLERDRHPRFHEALRHALVADLLPGDALYLPTRWWHHVQSAGVLNMMVNYWWQSDQPAPDAGASFDALVAALKAINQRKA